MHFTYFISLYLIVVVAVTFFYIIKIDTYRESSQSSSISLLSLSLCLYIIGYALELNSADPHQLIFWNNIEYLGIPFIATIWMKTILMYTDIVIHHKKLFLIAIYTIPFITLILRFTNDYHHLYFANIGYKYYFYRLILVLYPGPWMYIFIVYSIIMLIISWALFIREVIKSKYEKHYKLIAISITTIFILLGPILSWLQHDGIGIDYMAICFPVAAITMTIVISRFDLFTIKTLARSKVFEASSDAILIVTNQNVVVDYNKSAEKLFAKVDIKLEKIDLLELFKNNSNIKEAISKDEDNMVRIFTQGEKHYYNIITEKIIENNMGQESLVRGWIKIFRDVTAIYKNNKLLNQQVVTDELSVLSNRRGFIEMGQKFIVKGEQTGSRIHMIMMDLDYFKQVNDKYGHIAGDIVIREFSQLLKTHFTDNCHVSRLGGEEFVVILSDYSGSYIYKMIRDFKNEAENHVYKYQEDEFHVTVSIGMTRWERGQQLTDILRIADKALYHSKNNGRNCISVM